MKKWLWPAVIIGVLVVVFLVLFSVFRGTKVEVVAVETRDVVELLVATGHIDVRPVSELAMDLGGVVAAVYVREGDMVNEGDILVELRRTESRQQVEGAELAKNTARSELARTSRGPQRQQVAEAQAAIDSAQASFDYARQEVERNQQLYASGIVTKTDVDAANTRLEQSRAGLQRAKSQLSLLESGARKEDVAVARAQVRQAESSLNLAEDQDARRVLRAPFSGLVLTRSVEPGEAISPGKPMITLANMDAAEIYLDTDENNLVNLRKDQIATVIVTARPTERFSAVVRQLGPEVDVDRGTVAVRLTPKSMPADFFPNMTVDVNIQINRIDGALSVPRTAVAFPRTNIVSSNSDLGNDGMSGNGVGGGIPDDESEDKDGSSGKSGERQKNDKQEEEGGESDSSSQAYVFVVKDGRAVRRYVKVLANGQDWVALQGVKKDEEVLLRVIAVDEGDRVRAREVTSVP